MSFRRQLSSGPLAGAMLSAGLALVAMSGGCVGNDLSLSITRFIPPSSGGSAGACVFDAASILNQTRGVWDVEVAKFFPIGYNVNFIVKNNLESKTTTGIETQAFYVNSFDVVLVPEGPIIAAIPPSRREFNFKSGSIRVGPADSVSAYVEAIAPDLTAAIAAIPAEPLGLVTVQVRAVGTRGEQETASAYSSFPIEVCKGCLSNSKAGSFPGCPLPLNTDVLPGNPCNPSQDQGVTCCTPDANKSLLCGNAAKPPTT